MLTHVRESPSVILVRFHSNWDLSHQEWFVHLCCTDQILMRSSDTYSYTHDTHECRAKYIFVLNFHWGTTWFITMTRTIEAQSASLEMSSETSRLLFSTVISAASSQPWKDHFLLEWLSSVRHASLPRLNETSPRVCFGVTVNTGGGFVRAQRGYIKLQDKTLKMQGIEVTKLSLWPPFVKCPPPPYNGVNDFNSTLNSGWKFFPKCWRTL